MPFSPFFLTKNTTPFSVLSITITDSGSVLRSKRSWSLDVHSLRSSLATCDPTGL